MVKIAFSGKLCSGKSTMAEYVRTTLEADFLEVSRVLSFAGKLKEIAADLFDMKFKDRDLLIAIGLKMREIRQDVWLDYIVKQTNTDCCSVIIDDLRFPNEFDRLRKEGFILIRLNISKETQLSRLHDVYYGGYEAHIRKLEDPSETALDNHQFDYTIESEDIQKTQQVLLELLKLHQKVNTLDLN